MRRETGRLVVFAIGTHGETVRRHFEQRASWSKDDGPGLEWISLDIADDESRLPDETTVDDSSVAFSFGSEGGDPQWLTLPIVTQPSDLDQLETALDDSKFLTAKHGLWTHLRRHFQHRLDPHLVPAVRFVLVGSLAARGTLEVVVALAILLRRRTRKLWGKTDALLSTNYYDLDLENQISRHNLVKTAVSALATTPRFGGQPLLDRCYLLAPVKENGSLVESEVEIVSAVSNLLGLFAYSSAARAIDDAGWKAVQNRPFSSAGSSALMVGIDVDRLRVPDARFALEIVWGSRAETSASTDGIVTDLRASADELLSEWCSRRVPAQSQRTQKTLEALALQHVSQLSVTAKDLDPSQWSDLAAAQCETLLGRSSAVVKDSAADLVAEATDQLVGLSQRALVAGVPLMVVWGEMRRLRDSAKSCSNIGEMAPMRSAGFPPAERLESALGLEPYPASAALHLGGAAFLISLLLEGDPWSRLVSVGIAAAGGVVLSSRMRRRTMHELEIYFTEAMRAQVSMPDLWPAFRDGIVGRLSSFLANCQRIRDELSSKPEQDDLLTPQEAETCAFRYENVTPSSSDLRIDPGDLLRARRGQLWQQADLVRSLWAENPGGGLTNSVETACISFREDVPTSSGDGHVLAALLSRKSHQGLLDWVADLFDRSAVLCPLIPTAGINVESTSVVSCLAVADATAVGQRRVWTQLGLTPFELQLPNTVITARIIHGLPPAAFDLSDGIP